MIKGIPFEVGFSISEPTFPEQFHYKKGNILGYGFYLFLKNLENLLFFNHPRF